MSLQNATGMQNAAWLSGGKGKMHAGRVGKDPCLGGVMPCPSALPGTLVPPRSDKLVSVCTQWLVPDLLINKTSWLQQKLVFPRLHNYVWVRPARRVLWSRVVVNRILQSLRKLLTYKMQHLHLPQKASLICLFSHCCLYMVVDDKSWHSSALAKSHSNKCTHHNLAILIILCA